MLEVVTKSGSDGSMNRGQNVCHIRNIGWPEELSITKGKK
jgi:hypothetical protein